MLVPPRPGLSLSRAFRRGASSYIGMTAPKLTWLNLQVKIIDRKGITVLGIWAPRRLPQMKDCVDVVGCEF